MICVFGLKTKKEIQFIIKSTNRTFMDFLSRPPPSLKCKETYYGITDHDQDFRLLVIQMQDMDFKLSLGIPGLN